MLNLPVAISLLVTLTGITGWGTHDIHTFGILKQAQTAKKDPYLGIQCLLNTGSSLNFGLSPVNLCHDTINVL
jgi:hypothetical protein